MALVTSVPMWRYLIVYRGQAYPLTKELVKGERELDMDGMACIFPYFIQSIWHHLMHVLGVTWVHDLIPVARDDSDLWHKVIDPLQVFR